MQEGLRQISSIAGALAGRTGDCFTGAGTLGSVAAVGKKHYDAQGQQPKQERPLPSIERDSVMLADHDALVSAWRANSRSREDANFRFLRSLKMVDDPDEIDDLAREVHADVFAHIDCTRCANCCKTMAAGLNDQDIERIAAQMTRQEFIDAYLRADQERPGRFLMRAIPCPFLGPDDHCTIYAIRPDSCQKFPHTNQEGFAFRSYQHTSNTLTCPAVYHIVQEMRKALKG